MKILNDSHRFQKYHVTPSPRFLNNNLPVLHYQNILSPGLFLVFKLKRLLRQHNWFRFHVQGMLTYHHYHSNAHIMMAVLKGSTTLQLGGETGPRVVIDKGDVLVIPAGVVYKNLKDEHDVNCLVACYNGIEYDINCGHPSERPAADHSIQQAALPITDPLFGNKGPLLSEWSKLAIANKIRASLLAEH